MVLFELNKIGIIVIFIFEEQKGNNKNKTINDCILLISLIKLNVNLVLYLIKFLTGHLRIHKYEYD